jgi:SAM-dependent methyltransferase
MFEQMPNFAFLRELRRITKPDGFLIIDDGHHPARRPSARSRPAAAGRLQMRPMIISNIRLGNRQRHF